MAEPRVSNWPRGLIWWCPSQKALLVESIFTAEAALNVSPLELVSASLAILGTNCIASLLIQRHSNLLIAPNADPSHANINIPTGKIFKMSTSSLESSLTKLADITAQTESLILFSHTLVRRKSYVFGLHGFVSENPNIRVSSIWVR